MTVPHTLTFDAAPSARSTDENGFLHVASSHITKATVNPYYGREIPGWREAGLDPEAVYYGFRDPEELKKSLSTWQGLPLHIEHHVDSAEEPARLTRVGAVGRADWNAPYVDAPLTVWDGEAIAAIEDGSFRELSCAYRYDPDFTPGRYEGVEYDFIMRNIRGNHVALVEEGRAGPDVVVADGALCGKDAEEWRTAKNGKKYRINTETGEITRGNIGQKSRREPNRSTPLESTKPDTARYEALLKEQQGDHQKAAHAYFREKLQGRHVEARTDKGTIQVAFTGGTWQELKRGMKQDALKAELVPHMPDIISTGQYQKNDLYKDRTDKAIAFHSYSKAVDTSEGRKDAIVDVVERKENEPRYSAYNMTREGSKSFETRKERDAKIKKDTALSVMPSGYLAGKDSPPYPVSPGLITDGRSGIVENSIVPTFEVVNVRIAGSEKADGALDKKESPASGVGNKPTVGGDSTGFQPTVDFNIAIKPVRVNPQPDADTTRNPKLIQGAFMGKLKRWFRGAQDDNPEIEKQEVELAQAIIDLHTVDPVTGEIVDITEDEDKAEEIRRLIGELSAKLDPQEVKKLTDSLTDLACSRATGDERKTDAMDEEMKKAMDKCGLDAEDPTASQAFAEGVKYGEELERNPEERRRLDREHESEGMKKAMDACGLDAENPAESRAFAEGVKYGEELIRNPEERRKLDREHEAAGMKKAMGKDEDKNAAITRILDDVPDLTPEQRKRLFDSLQDLAYSPATGDADPSEVKTAQDRAFRSPRHLTAMDAARIKASAIAEAQNHMRGLHQAVRDVRGLVGDLDPLSFDSASDVYGYALKQSGIDPRRYPRQAWRGMIDMLRAGKTAELSGGMARDAAPARLDGKFAGLNNISLAD